MNPKKIIYLLALFFCFSLFLSHPTFAAESADTSTVVETTFFGNIDDDGSGCGVFTILNTVVDILSIGVGVLGVIAISISGIQYLTSAGNEEQARKSRHRIFQIIIGLAVYAIMYTGINWLTPGGKLNTGSECATITNAELAKRRAAENAAKNKANSSSSSNTNKTTNKANSKNQGSSKIQSIPGTDYKNASTVGKKMLEAAEWSARYMANNKFIYYQWDNGNGFPYRKIRNGYGPKKGVYKGIQSLTWKQAKEWRISHCSSFATLVEKKAGLLPDNKTYHSYVYKGKIHYKNSATKSAILKNFKIIHGNGATLKSLAKQKKIAPGDVFGYPNRTHTMIYAGTSNGKYWIYEVTGGVNRVLKYENDIHKSISGSKKIEDILHAK